MIPDLQMNQWWQYIICLILLAVGVFCLIKGSDIMVSGASSIAKKFKIPGIIIGLTVVAFGTSCPELAVSVSDSINCLIKGGNAEVAIGNVVGSNICNILIVLGCSALFTPIIINKGVLKIDFPIMIGVTLLCVIFCLTAPSNPPYEILRWEGAILVVGIIAYVTYIVLATKKAHKNKDNEIEEIKRGDDSITEYSTTKSILFTVLGLILIIAGGEATVYGAKNIAIGVGTSTGADVDLVSSVVGLTIVAVGTSLPELVTSIVAAKKGQNDMALGNVIGSNIFNILFVLGLSAVVNPLVSGGQLLVDVLVMLGVTILVFILSLRGKLTRSVGIVFILLYITYVSYLVCRTCGVF